MQIEKAKPCHLTIALVIHNKQDLWIPLQETHAGEQVQMKPYRILMRPPEGKDLSSHHLIKPFTPGSKDNMVAWVAIKWEQLLQRPRRPEISRSMNSLRKILAN
jgi:uncharacterized membrane protein (UPF0182 family)